MRSEGPEFDALRQTPLFLDLDDDALNAAMEKFRFVDLGKGDFACREGEEGSSLFIVVKGAVEVIAKDHDGHTLVLAALNRGEFFGEFAMLFGGRRRYSVRARTEVRLCEITHGTYSGLAQEFPPIERVVLDFYRRRTLSNLLHRADLFSGLSPEKAKQIIERGALGTYAPGAPIIKEGEPGGNLYVITDGEVEVQTSVRDEKLHIASLRAGDVFGEISVLTGTMCTADVVSKGNTVVVKYPKEELFRIMAEFPEIKEKLSQIRERRLHETMKKITDALCLL